MALRSCTLHPRGRISAKVMDRRACHDFGSREFVSFFALPENASFFRCECSTLPTAAISSNQSKQRWRGGEWWGVMKCRPETVLIFSQTLMGTSGPMALPVGRQGVIALVAGNRVRHWHVRSYFVRQRSESANESGLKVNSATPWHSFSCGKIRRCGSISFAVVGVRRTQMNELPRVFGGG